jgi:hypothetical protein
MAHLWSGYVSRRWAPAGLSIAVSDDDLRPPVLHSREVAATARNSVYR